MWLLFVSDCWADYRGLHKHTQHPTAAHPPSPLAHLLTHPAPSSCGGTSCVPLQAGNKELQKRGVNKGSSCIMPAAPSHLLAHLLTHPAPFPLFLQGTSCISLQPGNIVLREKSRGNYKEGGEQKIFLYHHVVPHPLLTYHQSFDLTLRMAGR